MISIEILMGAGGGEGKGGRKTETERQREKENSGKLDREDHRFEILSERKKEDSLGCQLFLWNSKLVSPSSSLPFRPGNFSFTIFLSLYCGYYILRYSLYWSCFYFNVSTSVWHLKSCVTFLGSFCAVRLHILGHSQLFSVTTRFRVLCSLASQAATCVPESSFSKWCVLLNGHKSLHC